MVFLRYNAAKLATVDNQQLAQHDDLTDFDGLLGFFEFTWQSMHVFTTCI